jgi:hypothetical protein
MIRLYEADPLQRLARNFARMARICRQCGESEVAESLDRLSASLYSPSLARAVFETPEEWGMAESVVLALRRALEKVARWAAEDPDPPAGECARAA